MVACFFFYAAKIEDVAATFQELQQKVWEGMFQPNIFFEN